jgi:helix-turn-helix protein
MATITQLQSRPHYRIDNILIDEYGEKIGALGIAIYNALARYADRVTGICYPCIGTIAKKLKLSRTTVKKYLKILYKFDLIAMLHRTSPDGDPTSNSYMLLDPSPEKVALRRRQLEALLTPQTGTFTLPGGRSPADLPPCPSAPYPQSPDDPKQSLPLNKKNGTSFGDCPPTEKPKAMVPTEKQKACPHPPEFIVHLSDNITICHHCYGLLDEHLNLLQLKEEETPIGSEEKSPVEIVAA